MSELHKAQPWDALIKMANEIAFNIAPGQDQEKAVRAVADHIERFWARSMKTQIIDCLKMKDHQLQPTAVQAIKLLEQKRKHSIASE